MALDLEPIKERLDEATPGPWDFYVLPQSAGITVATIHSEHGPRETCWTVDLPPEIGGMGTEKDAEFIANAPEDIAALISEVERLRATVIVEQNRRQPWVKLAHQNAQEVKRLREQVDAVRAAVANHPDPCEKHPDDDAVTCGWKSAYRDVVHALEVQG